MKMHERLNKYNAIWLSMSAYSDLTGKNKSYEEVSQWNENEMKEMSQYLLGVVNKSLQGRSPSQRPIFNRTIGCTREMFELYMYARYKSHHDATLNYIEDALHCFHTFRDVWLLRQASNKAKAEVNTLRTERVKNRKVEEEKNAEISMPSKKRREMITWQD